MSEFVLSGKAPRVALMQPLFMPWLGYFSLIADADLFVFLDDFQFVRRSFHSRNRIFTGPGQADFVSVPVEHAGSQDVALNQIKPLIDDKFRRKFLQTITHNYRRSAFYDAIFPEVQQWIAQDYDSVAEMNIAFIKRICALTGINANFALSSEKPSEGQRSERILALLQAFGAQTYLSARGSFDYMQEDALFPAAFPDVYFQNYAPAPYDQVQSREFVSHLSVLDALMQLGLKQTFAIINQGRNPYLSWQDMVESRAISAV